MSRSSQCSLLYDEPSVISLLIGCPSQTVLCSFGYMNAHLDFPPKQQTSSSLNRWSNQTLDAHSRSRPPRAEGNAADVYCIRSQSCDAPPAQLNMIRELNMEPFPTFSNNAQTLRAQLRLKVNYINQGKYLIQKTLIIFTQTRAATHVSGNEIPNSVYSHIHQLFSPSGEGGDLSCTELTRRSFFGWQLASCRAWTFAAPPKHFVLKRVFDF